MEGKDFVVEYFFSYIIFININFRVFKGIELESGLVDFMCVVIVYYIRCLKVFKDALVK